MTDNKVTLTPRNLQKNPDGSYTVIEWLGELGWVAASKKYAHSTSAFAALGRLTQKETNEQL